MTMNKDGVSELTRPIIGIENRTPQEVFDIMADRFRAADRRAPAVVTEERRAPVQGYSAGIPWAMHLRAYDAYCKKYSPQPALIDMDGRGCRGGFSTNELDMFIPGWRDEISEINRLKTALEAAIRSALVASHAEPVAAPEAVITGHQAAYACLWRLPSDDPEFHSVRRKLLSVLGGQGSDAQRYALQWAQRTLGASEVSECMRTDAPCTCGGADCEQISFVSPPSPPSPSIPAGYRLVPEEPTEATWRDMESAPKDGTDVLLMATGQTYQGQPVADRVTVGHWTSDEECHTAIGDCGGECRCPEYWFGDPYWMSWDGGFTAENPPNGWMPLPPPIAAPAQQQEGDGE